MSLIVLLCLVAFVASHPLPQQLTEEEFLSARRNPEDNKIVFQTPSYSKVEFFGARSESGRSIKDFAMFPVRNPFSQEPRQNFLQQRREKIVRFPDMAPVFNLQEMLEAEKEKLRMKVEEASLMAAKAAEEAEEKVMMLAEIAMNEAGVNQVEVEDIIEKTIDSAIEEAKEIFEHEGEIKETSTEQQIIDDVNADQIFSSQDIEEVENETTETSEPSSDIDLGSVQEVTEV